MTVAQANILGAILAERRRQDELHPHFPESLRTAILGEEFGEVCKAYLESDNTSLREELIQVAAVAVRWIEAIEAKDGAKNEHLG